MKTTNFFVESLKNLKTVGTLTPCSPAAAKKMTKPVDFSKAEVIVELGGGTGAITKEILKNMNAETKLFVFEINPNFAKSLRELSDGRMVVINDSATKIVERLKSFGVQKADYVISTLPLALMDKPTKDEVFKAVTDVLKVKGRYIQIQYSLVSKKQIKEKFGNIKVDFTPLNFPPAFFYICER